MVGCVLHAHAAGNTTLAAGSAVRGERLDDEVPVAFDVEIDADAGIWLALEDTVDVAHRAAVAGAVARVDLHMHRSRGDDGGVDDRGHRAGIVERGMGE